MSPRTLKIVLAVSVALNLFAAAGGVAAWAHWKSVESRAAEVHRAPRGGPIMETVGQLEPGTRARVRQAMRETALAARPDFEEARTARREAVELARAETFDASATAALLQRSREAELRGRTRIETGAVAVLETLEPADRQALAPILSRHRNRGPGRGFGRDRARGPAQASAPAAAPANP